jgi:hypothetical protein
LEPQAREFFTRAQRHHGEKPNVDAATLQGSMWMRQGRLDKAQVIN